MKNRNRIKVTALAVLFAFTMAGCQNEAKAPAQPESASAETEEKKPVETEVAVEEPAPVEEASPAEETGEAEKPLFTAFLDGEGTIINDTESTLCFSVGESLNLQDFLDGVNKRLAEEFGEDEPMKVLSLKSAEIDCGNDGVTDYALMIEADREEAFMPLYDYFVLVEEDGNLYIREMFESYYRSSGDLNKYGVFMLSGSNSAASGVTNYSRVNGNGEYEFIYQIEYTLALTAPVINRYSLPESLVPEDYPEQEWTSDGSDGIECDIYTFEEYPPYGEEGYDEYLMNQTFTFTENGEDVWPTEELMEFYNANGITVTDKGTADGMVHERLVTLEITEDELLTPDEAPENAIEWAEVPLP